MLSTMLLEVSPEARALLCAWLVFWCWLWWFVRSEREAMGSKEPTPPPESDGRWDWTRAEHRGHPAPLCTYCGKAMPIDSMRDHEQQCQRPTSPPPPPIRR